MIDVDGLTPEQIQEDMVFLLARSMKAGSVRFSSDRDTGTSSNSLVRLAYVPHSPPEMPSDMSDLRACELAVDGLPEHRKTEEVLDWLVECRNSVHDKFSTENG